MRLGKSQTLRQDAARQRPGRSKAEYRALQVYELLEPRHRTFLVPDNRSAPHLRAGEYAVIDTADVEPQHGELYLIQWSSGARRRCIVQARADHLNITGPGAEPSLCWWVGDLVRVTIAQIEAMKARAKPGEVPVITGGLSDGAYQTDHLRSKLLGRVVGVAFSPLGGIIAPEAGWENEEAGNADFDPAEYVDVLLSVGYKPMAHVDDRRRRSLYIMHPDEVLTEEVNELFNSVAWKYCRASNATAMTIAECVRRKLVF